jgi:signal transduction histidine kinase
VEESVVKIAVDGLRSIGGWLYLFDERDKNLRCEVRFHRGKDIPHCIQSGVMRVAERVVQERKSVLAQEELRKGAEISDPGKEKGIYYLGAPVILHEKILGCLMVYRRESAGNYTSAETEQLIHFSDQIALCREAEILRQKLDQRRLDLVNLNELTKALLDTDDIQALTERLAFHLNKMIGSDGCYVFLKGPSSHKLPGVVAAPSAGFSTLDPNHPSHLPSANKILERGNPFLIVDGQESPYLEPELAQMLSLNSALAYPMMVAGVEMGAALVIYHNDHQPDEDEIAICDQALRSFILAIDKIRLFEDEHHRRSVLEAVRQASIRLTSSLELEPVLDAILNQVLSLVKADDAHIFLYEEDQLTFAAARWADGRPSEPYALPREDGITYSVARSGKKAVSPDVNLHSLFKDWKWGGAIVSHPLKIEEQVVGVMNVAFESPHTFLEEELRVLELLAAQAAIALQNARLFSYIHTDRNRVQLLLEVTNTLVTELDEDSILQRAMDVIAKSLEASIGEAFLLEPNTGGLRLRALAGKSNLNKDEIDKRLDLCLNRGLEGWVAEWKEPVAIPEVGVDERWVHVEGVSDDIQSALCVPVISEGVVFGVLTVLFNEVGKVDQLDLLTAVGRQVGLALSNAYKYRQINRRVAELSALQEVAKVINSRVEMNRLLEEVVYQVSQVLGYEIVAVYLVEEDNLHLRAAVGAEEYRLNMISISQGVIGRVARTNEAAFIPDVTIDPDYLSSIPMSQAEIAVPLRRGDIVVGVLNVESPIRDDLNENDFRLLLLLSDQISVAIENASLYEHLRDQAGKLEEIVEERTAELADALENARVAERLKTQFVADVSHELRTPLANIRLYTELLSFGNPERFDEYIGTLARETDRLVNLIEELLAISRIDSGASIPHPKPMNLNRLLRNLVEDRQRLLNERSLKVYLDLMEQVPLVSVDEQMITQTVANLLTNAMHYTKPGGSITITTSVDWEGGEEWVKLSILDTGIGIPVDEQERVFERFYRGAASKLMTVPGTGLGLAISKELIDLHHGKITMSSRVGEGSEFVIWLPARTKIDKVD